MDGRAGARVAVAPSVDWAARSAKDVGAGRFWDENTPTVQHQAVVDRQIGADGPELTHVSWQLSTAVNKASGDRLK